MSKVKKPTAAEVTVQVIDGWKKEHGKIFKFVSTDGKTGYFKTPDMVTMEACINLANTGKPIQSNKMLAEACFVGGDAEVYEVQENLLGLGDKLKVLIQKVEGELTEL